MRGIRNTTCNRRRKITSTEAIHAHCLKTSASSVSAVSSQRHGRKTYLPWRGRGYASNVLVAQCNAVTADLHLFTMTVRGGKRGPVLARSENLNHWINHRSSVTAGETPKR